jgi:NAD(P)H-hydrate repair Nnr-like enzyme with NAD(P)H-hydrate epimerase domain
VLFTCGQGGCYADATAKARLLRAAGVEAQVAYAPFMGHMCHDEVAEETKRALPWVVAGDARWEAAL